MTHLSFVDSVYRTETIHWFLCSCSCKFPNYFAFTLECYLDVTCSCCCFWLSSSCSFFIRKSGASRFLCFLVRNPCVRSGSLGHFQCCFKCLLRFHWYQNCIYTMLEMFGTDIEVQRTKERQKAGRNLEISSESLKNWATDRFFTAGNCPPRPWIIPFLHFSHATHKQFVNVERSIMGWK